MIISLAGGDGLEIHRSRDVNSIVVVFNNHREVTVVVPTLSCLRPRRVGIVLPTSGEGDGWHRPPDLPARPTAQHDGSRTARATPSAAA